MLRNLPIAWRITALVLLGASLVLGAVSVYSYLSARDFLEEQKRAEVLATAHATANRIDTVTRSVEKIMRGVANTVIDVEPDRRQAVAILRRTVAQNAELYGSGIGYEPTIYGSRAPYVYQPSGVYGTTQSPEMKAVTELVVTDLGRGGRAYEIGDWFQLPAHMHRAVWTEPYYDEGGGNIVMATYAVPVHLGDDALPVSAVVGGDVSLFWLTRLLEGLDLGASGYAVLLSQTGTFIANPNEDLIMNESVFSVAEARDDPALRLLGRRMIAGRSGYVQFHGFKSLSPEGSSWLAYTPVPSTGWSLGIVFADSEISGDVVALSRIQWGMALAGIAALLLVALLIAGSITRPLRALDAATQSLAHGDLGAPLPQARGRDEIAHLTASFGQMRDDLTRYIDELRVTTAARERIESELRIASSIQMSLVPRTFPPYPQRHDLELNALLVPAREVGGDFYDFFLLDDDHLCLAIADVSGKGVPAALLMAVTRSFLRSFAREGEGPVQVLGWLNDELAADNDECMFVTMFLAVVDLRSGEVRYSNAGHNLPFLLGRAGGVTQIPHLPGVALGARAGIVYREGVLSLLPGDVLYLYTDGVSEAMNEHGEVYGEERLGEDLGRLCADTCDDILQALLAVLGAHAAGVEQSDDITMVALRYLGVQAAGDDGV